MEEVECVADLSGVESGLFLVKTTFPLHVKHEVTAVDKLNDEKQPARTHTVIYTHSHTRTQQYTHTATHAHNHIHTHNHTHTAIHAHNHIHTQKNHILFFEICMSRH